MKNTREFIVNNKLISAVMSVFNGEKYLAQAIESILNQTHSHFEFIIVNDGSTDNSVNIIKSFMEKDSRIVLIDRENKGLPYSLNEAISVSKGDYIARMDSDDISLPQRFEKQIEYMEKENLDVCGSFIETFTSGSITKNVTYPVSNEDIKFSLLFFSALAHPTVILKKDVFDKVKYNTNYKVAQDYQLWCDIISNDFKIGNTPEILLKYRVHDQQASVAKCKAQNETANQIALDYAKHLGEEEVNLANGIVASKNKMNLKQFKKLLANIKNYSHNKKISNDLLSVILKNAYLCLNPKSPFKYFAYRKSIDKKCFAGDFNLFLKSFIIFNRNSKLYSFLKKTKI